MNQPQKRPTQYKPYSGQDYEQFKKNHRFGTGFRVSDNVRRGASANFCLLRITTCCAYSFVLDILSLYIK
ncbi:unnamed protein product, partial [Adineta steineri]